jgi:hypothetical protein
VRDVVRHVDDLVLGQSGQVVRKERRGLLGVHLAHDVALVAQAGRLGVGHEPRVEGVGHGVQIGGREPGLGEHPGGGQLRQLPGAPRQRPLAVLASAEPLLLGGAHDPAVDDEGSGGVVVEGVDAEDLHAGVLLPPGAVARAR